MQLDWNALERDIGTALTDAVREFATASAEDLRSYGSGMAYHLVVAVRNGDVALKDEIRDQAKMLAELHRIRMNEFAEKAAGVVFATAFRVVLAAVKSAVAI